MRAQRRAQSVADAAALAGAQQLPDQAAAVGNVDNSALQNSWTGTPLQSLFPDPSTIKVVAQDDVSGLFAPLAGMFSISIGAQATARIGTSTSLANVVPLALRCQLIAPSKCDPWSMESVAGFTYTQNDPASTLEPLQLPLPNGQSWNTGRFNRYTACDAANPSNRCNAAPANAPATYLPFDRNGNQVRNALGNGGTHLVPVFDGITNGEYHVVGWAAVTFSNASGQGQTATVDVTFHHFFLDGRSLPSIAQPVAAQDFGVKAIALTG
jgi:hypothetical protein